MHKQYLNLISIILKRVETLVLKFWVGLYNLTLPAGQFNALGIYTLYLRPKQIRTRITDCGVLNALPNVKGIVIDITNVPTQYQNKFVSQGLVGFRIEYLNPDGSKIPNFLELLPHHSFVNQLLQMKQILLKNLLDIDMLMEIQI
jgi:hypothetical protein